MLISYKLYVKSYINYVILVPEKFDSWSKKCHFRSIFGSFPVKLPPEKKFLGKFYCTKRFVVEFHWGSLQLFLSYGAHFRRYQHLSIWVYCQLVPWLLKFTFLNYLTFNLDSMASQFKTQNIPLLTTTVFINLQHIWVSHSLPEVVSRKLIATITSEALIIMRKRK